MTPPLEKYRADFPFLAREIHGQPIVYLDSAASAQAPKQVLHAMTAMRESHYANVHRGIHALSDEATRAYEKARAVVQSFLNAEHEEEIVFTSGGTEALNLVARSFAAPIMAEGDEIILSLLEHHSNIVPWHMLRKEKGVVLKWLECDPAGHVSLKDYEKLFSKRTKLVAMTAMSNVLGVSPPLKEMIKIAHQKDAAVVLDGCQSAVHQKSDMRDMDCDFFAFSAHKLYGPNGIGVLYGKKAHLEKMPPFKGGGAMIASVTRDAINYAPPPQRFEAGTPPITEAVGLAKAVEYVSEIGLDKIAQHEKELLHHAREEIAKINAIRILGDEKSAALLSFVGETAHPHDLATIADRKGVALRAGHHCAQPLMEHLGIGATARASFALYNRHQEVEALAKALRYAVEFFA